MDKEQTRKAAEVMMGFAEGKEVEDRLQGSDDRWATTPFPIWNWIHLEYRLKPTPRTFYAVDYSGKSIGTSIGPLQDAENEARDHITKHPFPGARVIELVEVIR